ncbi:MAG TPA: 30S ribosomal protein S1 [Candidatus Binatia bacterium]|nr:30S ribosomal protein S1 [Candidatus Binatia bacterium]
MQQEKAQHEMTQRDAASESFSDMFEASVRPVQSGEIVKGHIVSIDNEMVTVDIGYKSEGMIPISEFQDRAGNLLVKEGQEVDVYVESTGGDGGEMHLSFQRARQNVVWKAIEEAYNSGGSVQGTVVGRVKGGLKVDVGVFAFLPGSHVDTRPTRSLDRYIGETTQFSILKFNRARGNVVVSRKALLEKEQEVMRAETLKVLEEGVILEGTVKNVTDYGAFVDLGGIDGLLHVTDMSWGRVSHPSKVVKPGEVIRVVVLKYDANSHRISLGLKQLSEDPWLTVADRLFPGSRVHGKVVSLTDYGAFVEIEDGIEGLVHVSEMSWTKRVTHPSQVLVVGDEVDVVVLSLDPENRRISLGLKQVTPNPWEMLPIEHPVGTRVKGKVTSVTDFGVFVNVKEGIDGLVHISDMHWTKKVHHPSEMVKKGDELECVVLGIDIPNERLSLGLKQLTEDPWRRMNERYPVGTRIHGKVTNIADFGVFVELEEGVEGLVHVSQIGRERVENPRDLFQPNQQIEAEVTQVDIRERRISLSIRSLLQSAEKEEMRAYMSSEASGSGRGGSVTLGDMIQEKLARRGSREETGKGE